MNKLLFFCTILFVVSCVRPTDIYTSAPLVNVDSLTANFLQGLNDKDSIAIIKTIAKNAVVMQQSIILNGDEAIAKNWIRDGVSSISNIKTASLITGSDNKIAYDAGTYSLDLVSGGKGFLEEKGNYNLIWTKQYNGEWKLTFVHLEDLSQMQVVAIAKGL